MLGTAGPAGVCAGSFLIRPIFVAMAFDPGEMWVTFAKSFSHPIKLLLRFYRVGESRCSYAAQRNLAHRRPKLELDDVVFALRNKAVGFDLLPIARRYVYSRIQRRKRPRQVLVVIKICSDAAVSQAVLRERLHRITELID